MYYGIVKLAPNPGPERLKYMQLHQLILYRHLLDDAILQKVQLLEQMGQEASPCSNVSRESLYYEIFSRLISYSEKLQLSGDIWKNYFLGLLVGDENVFSLACENSADISPSLFQLALRDMSILLEAYERDWSSMARSISGDCIPFLNDFQPGKADRSFNHHQQQNLIKLQQVLIPGISPAHMTEHLAGFYTAAGCGLMNKYLAFRWDAGLVGIDTPDPVCLKDLVGYQYQKQIITANTEAFLDGRKANNILLYGEKGTGKSSSVKALLNEYAIRGLRLIEISKNQLIDIQPVLRSVKGRSRYFIVFIDDLSFEDFEIEYKYIKASIEGSLEVKPGNILLYVTSNRKNLIRENWSERAKDDVHGFDSRQEKLSFADRFGITITYPSPDQEHFLAIVENLAKREGIEMPVEELRRQALQWERKYHGRSGRSAVQFIASLNP